MAALHEWDVSAADPVPPDLVQRYVGFWEVPSSAALYWLHDFTPGASDPPLEAHIRWVGPRWYGICGGSTIGTVSAVTRITWGLLPFHPFSCKFRIPVCYLPLWVVTG